MIIIDYETIPTPVFATFEGVFDYANKAFLDLTGFDLEELKGKCFIDVVHPDYQAEVKNVIVNDDIKSVEIKIICKNKVEKWAIITTTKAGRINEKRLIWFFCSEITDYKSLIEKLEIVEAQYADILNNMVEEVYRERPNIGATYVNNAWCRNYGIEKDKALGIDALGVVVPEDRYKYEVLKTLTPQNPYYSLECRVIRAGGKIVWLRCEGIGFFGKDGKLNEIQEVARDITDIKNNTDALAQRKAELEGYVREKTAELSEANQELISLNSYLNNILQNISEGVAVFDEKGNLEKVNNFLKKSWGSLLPIIIEKFRKDIVYDLASPISKMIREKVAFSNHEVIIETPNNNINCLVSGAPLDEKQGELRKGVIIIRSISEVHQLVSRYSGFQARFRFEDIITNNPVMKRIIQYGQIIAKNQMNIMIEGESGTGKEMFAQSIHNASDRSKGPFIGVNCGAIPGELIGSELFGYTDGSFTGAKKGGKPGKFELASGGTVFLDEIAEMPLAQQVVLLRVLQEKKLVRVGGDREIPINARIICATNKNLLREVQLGNFRQDLYYRLNVLNLKIPPLRERIDDILILLEYFFQKLQEAGNQFTFRVDPSALGMLLEYDWPGNIRELQNIVERSLFMFDGKDITLESQHLPDMIRRKQAIVEIKQELPSEMVFDVDNFKTLDLHQLKEKNQMIFAQQEKIHIKSLMDLFDNNLSLVARKMDISRNTLYKKLKKYSMEV